MPVKYQPVLKEACWPLMQHMVCHAAITSTGLWPQGQFAEEPSADDAKAFEALYLLMSDLMTPDKLDAYAHALAEPTAMMGWLAADRWSGRRQVAVLAEGAVVVAHGLWAGLAGAEGVGRLLSATTLWGAVAALEDAKSNAEEAQGGQEARDEAAIDLALLAVDRWMELFRGMMPGGRWEHLRQGCKEGEDSSWRGRVGQAATAGADAEAGADTAAAAAAAAPGATAAGAAAAAAAPGAAPGAAGAAAEGAAPGATAAAAASAGAAQGGDAEATVSCEAISTAAAEPDSLAGLSRKELQQHALGRVLDLAAGRKAGPTLGLTSAMALAGQVLGEGGMELTASVQLVLRHQEFWGAVRGAVAAGPDDNLSVLLGRGLLQRAEELWGDGESVQGWFEGVGGSQAEGGQLAAAGAAVAAAAAAAEAALQTKEGPVWAAAERQDVPRTTSSEAGGQCSTSSEAGRQCSTSSEAGRQCSTSSEAGGQPGTRSETGGRPSNVWEAGDQCSTSCVGRCEQGDCCWPAARECRRCCVEGGALGGLWLCSGCMRVRYCSKECQREDWKRHRGICRRVQQQGLLEQRP